MQEIRRENALLLQLVKSLEGEINSKNRENQLLFTQYQQLASENRQLANHNSTLMQENQTLKRTQPTKENYKYSYAILNSPRTQKLQVQISDLAQQMARQRNELQQTLLQLQKITKQKEQLQRIVLQLEKNNQEESIRKSNQRIDYLEKDLWRKEKEMKELTLIMYAKDATASEISFKQEEKNRQIDVLKKQIQRLKGEKERDYKINEQRRQNQQKKKTERIQFLEIMLEQASKKGNQERKHHQYQIQRMAQLHNNHANDKAFIKQLQNQLNEQRIRNKQRQIKLLAQLQLKSQQSLQKTQQLKVNAQKLQQISQFANSQTHLLSLKNKQILKQTIKTNHHQLTIAKQQSFSIAPQQQKKQRHIIQYSNNILQKQLSLQQIKLIEIKKEAEEYRRQLQSSLLRLSQIQNFNKQYKEQIAQSQRIKSILVSQIQKSDLIIKQMKRQIFQLQQRRSQIIEQIQKKSYESFALDQQLSEKRSQKLYISSKNESLLQQKERLSIQLNQAQNAVQHNVSPLQKPHQNMLQNQQSKVAKQSDIQKQQLRKQLQQMQQSTNSFMQILQNLQQQLRNKQTINQQLRNTHEKCSLNLSSQQSSLKKISQLQAQKQQLSKFLQKYIQQCNQNKERICELQSQITDIITQSQKRQQSNIETADRKQPIGQHYIEMLNAVIEQIKSQHQSSISRIQSKNILIQELQRRLKQSQDHYQQQISTLRTSIATGQLQNLDFQSLSKKYRQQQTSKANETKCAHKGLQQSLQALRQQIRRKDTVIQQLSLFKAKAEQQKQKIGVMNLSSILLNQTSNDKNQQICDASHRPISSIISPDNSEYHHYNEQYQDSPSQIQLQNEQLHQTVQQLNYIIASLQKELIVLQNHYNSEIMQLQKTIARTNAQVIALRRSIAESNPKLHELDKLARDFCVRPEPSRLASKIAPRNRMNSPTPIDLTYSGDYKADLSQSITKLSKSSLISPNLKSSSILPKSSDSFHQPQQIRTNSSNPYIKQMTDQNGNLKFPTSGNWSIQQLRSLLQSDHN